MKPDFDAIIRQVDANPYPRHSMFTDGDGNPVDFGDYDEENQAEQKIESEESVEKNAVPKKKSNRGRPKKTEQRKMDDDLGTERVYVSKKTAYELTIIKALCKKDNGTNFSYGEIISTALETATKTQWPKAYEILYKK